MAPRHSGGSSSSGSPGCDGCNSPLTLRGFHWMYGVTVAFFVIYCISLVMVLVCLAGVAFYNRWRAANDRTGKFSLATYLSAVTLTLINLSLNITNIALSEERTIVARSYYVLYEFILAAALFSTILTLILVAQAVKSVVAAHSHAFGLGVKLVGLLLSGLAIAMLGLYARGIAYYINEDDDTYILTRQSWSEAQSALRLTFNLIVLITLFAILVILVKGFRSIQQPKAYRTLALLAVLTFIVAWILAIVSDAIYLGFWRGVGLTYSFDSIFDVIQAFLFALVLVFCFALACVSSRGPSYIIADGHMPTKTSAN